MVPIKIVKYIIVLLLFAFFGTVFLAVSGYYQTELQKRTVLTQEAIDRFESDLKDGKDVNVDNYLEIKDKNYDNRVSESGRFLPNKLNNFISIIKAIEE